MMAIDMVLDLVWTLVLATALWVAGAWIIATCISMLSGGAVLLLLPATYFRDDRVRPASGPWWSPDRVC